jgi:hypothetical protein
MQYTGVESITTYYAVLQDLLKVENGLMQDQRG